MLGDIFGGQFSLFPSNSAIGAAAPCSLSAIMAFCYHNSRSQAHWEQVLPNLMAASVPRRPKALLAEDHCPPSACVSNLQSTSCMAVCT